MHKILFLVIIPAVFILTLIIYFTAPPTLENKEHIFVILLTDNQDNVFQRLKNEKFIRNPEVISSLLSYKKFPGKIEPGSYKLKKNMFIWNVADTLTHDPYQKWITLVPGLRVEQTAGKLAGKFGWKEAFKQEFLKYAREGYMFPDTYLLNVDYSPEEFAQRIISNFNEKFDAKLQADLLARDVRNDTAVKIASLIERESGGDADKALISGIIWNRLLTGMKLDIDATIQYAIGTEKDWWPRVSPKNIRETDSPFNTYFTKNLPPTPICSPSLASIEAAVYPAETDCLFYLHDPGKNIHCSPTYQGHLENIDRYLR